MPWTRKQVKYLLSSGSPLSSGQKSKMVSELHENPAMGHEKKGSSKMAKLGSGARNKLPKSSFGMPGERKYPMPDKSHARNAKARASQQYNKGNISESTKEHIDAMANKKMGYGHGKEKMPAQHHDKAHPKGPKHPPSHTYHKIMHGDHSNKMTEG